MQHCLWLNSHVCFLLVVKSHFLCHCHLWTSVILQLQELLLPKLWIGIEWAFHAELFPSPLHPFDLCEKKNQKHSQTGTLINRSIRNNYFITVLYKLWEKNLLFKINTKKINEIFFSKAFYFKDCYWYYRHWPMPFMGHVLLLQSEATQTQRGVGNGNMYWSLPCFCLAVLWHGKVQQSNHICSSLQQQ